MMRNLKRKPLLIFALHLFVSGVNAIDADYEALSKLVEEIVKKEIGSLNDEFEDRVAMLQDVSEVQTHEELEERVAKLEDLSKGETLSTCSEYKSVGLKNSGY